jgi:hypothetical protein
VNLRRLEPFWPKKSYDITLFLWCFQKRDLPCSFMKETEGCLVAIAGLHVPDFPTEVIDLELPVPLTALV